MKHTIFIDVVEAVDFIVFAETVHVAKHYIFMIVSSWRRNTHVCLDR